MKISKYQIATPDLDKVVNYIVKNLPFDYENHSSDMSILASEEYYLRNNSSQMNMVIAKRKDSSIFIDIIGGAGGKGILNINLWSEQGYIKRVRKVLNNYCEEFGLELEEL